MLWVLRKKLFYNLVLSVLFSFELHRGHAILKWQISTIAESYHHAENKFSCCSTAYGFWRRSSRTGGGFHYISAYKFGRKVGEQGINFHHLFPEWIKLFCSIVNFKQFDWEYRAQRR